MMMMMMMMLNKSLSYLDCQHDATHNRSLGVGSSYRSTAGGMRRRQLSIDNCCPRSSSAANQPHVAAAVDRQDRQTDGHPTVTQTLYCILSV